MDLELGLNDYPEIIKNPMDLKKVRKNLTRGKYKIYQDFFKDINLIWENCKQYNKQGSDIFALADHMDKLSKRLINEFRQ